MQGADHPVVERYASQFSAPDSMTTDGDPCSYLLMDVSCHDNQVMYLVIPIQSYGCVHSLNTTTLD